MERREYGSTGEQLSIIGFGGILVSQTEPAEAAALVREAVARGVNYFDVAPSYSNAEERLGGKRGNSPDVNRMPGKTGAPRASERRSPLAANGGLPLVEARVDLPEK